MNVVGLKLQAYELRPNGGMGIYWNLHVSVKEIYKFVFLQVKYLFSFRETILVSYMAWTIHLKVKVVK